MAEAEYSNFQTKLEVCQHEKKKKKIKPTG